MSGIILDLPGLIDRNDRQATLPGPSRGLIQARHGKPAHHRHRREGVSHGPVEQPLGLIRRAVPHMLGDRPPVAPGDLAHQRGGVLARLEPRLHPRKARLQQSQQFSTLPPAKAGTYPGGSSRPAIGLPSHPHDREAVASIAPDPRRSAPIQGRQAQSPRDHV